MAYEISWSESTGTELNSFGDQAGNNSVKNI